MWFLALSGRRVCGQELARDAPSAVSLLAQHHEKPERHGAVVLDAGEEPVGVCKVVAGFEGQNSRSLTQLAVFVATRARACFQTARANGAMSTAQKEEACEERKRFHAFASLLLPIHVAQVEPEGELVQDQRGADPVDEPRDAEPAPPRHRLEAEQKQPEYPSNTSPMIPNAS